LVRQAGYGIASRSVVPQVFTATKPAQGRRSTENVAQMAHNRRGFARLPWRFALKPEKILFSKAASAQLLDISIRTLENLITAGKIPIMRIGRRVVISQHALDKFAYGNHEGSQGGAQ
jgi:excisionase family DNA binding protein